MSNPFKNNGTDRISDEELVRLSLEGKRKALEQLVRRHQRWIYNIALRMTAEPEDAEDVTQEVLLVILTKLSTFKGKSRFRTWLYRIVANFVINMKKKKTEKLGLHASFAAYGGAIDKSSDRDPPDPKSIPVDLPLLLEEIKTFCMMGMLLCLNREQRLVFILGEIFGVNDEMGSEIFEISKVSFRKKLSRARKSVYSFMKVKCGLVDEKNSCHCDRKAKGLINGGWIDPGHLRFTPESPERFRQVFEEKRSRFADYMESKCYGLFRDQPLMDPPDYVKSLQEILDSSEFRDIFNVID